MGTILLLIVCCLFSSIAGGVGWYLTNMKKEGDPCEGSDEYAEYVTDAEGNCVLDKCIDGYKEVDGVCVTEKVEQRVVEPAPVLELEPPPETSPSGRVYTIREYSTNPDEDGGGSVLYLDRQNVDCEDDALNGFQLERKADESGNLDRLSYSVSCLDGVNSGTTDMKDTSTGIADRKTWFLDRHEVDCERAPISKFKLNRPSQSLMNYEYKCSTLEHTGECRNLQTEFSNDGGGSAHNLDRHDLKCNKGEAMTSFKLIRNPLERRHTEGDRIAYKYTCCKMP
jgi:hypothetical protein